MISFVILYANCCSNCYYNFNLCGIFEKMTSFSPILNQDFEQGKLLVAINSWKKMVQKTQVLMFVYRVKFGKISRKGLLCTKM